MGYQGVHTVLTKWTIPPRGYEFTVSFAGICQRSRDDWSKTRYSQIPVWSWPLCKQREVLWNPKLAWSHVPYRHGKASLE